MKPNPWWPRFNKSRTVGVTPNRLFGRSTKFLTMGSCFANEIRSALMQNGLTVLPETQSDLLPLFSPQSHEDSSWGGWDERVHLQYYHTYSLRQEFEKAFGHWEQSENDYWTVTMPDGQIVYQDPYRRGVFAPTVENLQAIIRGLDAALKNAIETTDVFIFTLGLTEVWRQKQSQLVACAEPGYRSGGGADSTSFHASTFEENLANMKRVMDLIVGHYPDKKIFVTVSPVALGRTFRDVDIAVANMESKSILRTVAAILTATYPNVTYFPSYEMCMYNQERAFLEDGRHVRRDQVEQIVRLFMTSYFLPDELDAPHSVATTERQKLEMVIAHALRRFLKVDNADAQHVFNVFLAGYYELAQNRPFPDESYKAMRHMHSVGPGWLNHLVHQKVTEMFPGPPSAGVTSPLLGSLGRDDAENIVAQMRRDGVTVLEQKLSGEFIDRLRTRVAETPLLPGPGGGYDSAALLRAEEIWQLIGDPVLLHLVGRYFDCEPIFQFASANLARPDPAATAEDVSFAFDTERLGSVKVAIHLSDISDEAGPGLVVAGSHQARDDPFWEDRSYTPAEIADHYPAGLIRRTTGPAGTIVLIDDWALQASPLPRDAERTMLSIDYAISNAGKHRPSPPGKWADNAFAQKLSISHPRLLTSLYQRQDS